MKKAVVTGANGFIGNALVSLLVERGYFVYAVTAGSNLLTTANPAQVLQIPATFDEYPSLVEKIEGPIDCFFHLAWMGVWGKPFSDYELQFFNAVETGKTFEIAEKLSTRKFVLASTVNVLETKKLVLQQKIGQNLRATTNYGMAKLSAEMICKTLSCKGETSFSAAYIAMAYGPNNYSLMVPNVVISKLLRDESPDLIVGNGLYDLIYIDDIVKGLLAIGEHGDRSESYYLGHSELRTFREIFSDIGGIINPDVPLNFGAYPDENQIDYSLIDLRRLTDICGWKPEANFRESILKTAEFLKEAKLLEAKK